MKKIFIIEHDDDLGEEWLCIDNFLRCLTTPEHIGSQVRLAVSELRLGRKMIHEATDLAREVGP